jgi:hypothetical protein
MWCEHVKDPQRAMGGGGNTLGETKPKAKNLKQMKTKMPKKETKQNKIQRRLKLKTQTEIGKKKEEPVQRPIDPAPDPT